MALLLMFCVPYFCISCCQVTAQQALFGYPDYIVDDSYMNAYYGDVSYFAGLSHSFFDLLIGI